MSRVWSRQGISPKGIMSKRYYVKGIVNNREQKVLPRQKVLYKKYCNGLSFIKSHNGDQPILLTYEQHSAHRSGTCAKLPILSYPTQLGLSNQPILACKQAQVSLQGGRTVQKRANITSFLARPACCSHLSRSPAVATAQLNSGSS